ncbi:ATP-binding protein, partial [Tyzzerella sp. OttesenSCG-928-J15]|nr:ATP-binding protein [Tyzzerella sp. OttesenSCG-928-J15]
LLSNAIHYTGSDKKIYITQLEEKDYVKIEITDTGAGIDEDELENIWERYYKSGENHRRNIQGTGLGLSIVKSIMKLHGCKYGVNSVKNQGSTFYFYLKKAKKS